MQFASQLKRFPYVGFVASQGHGFRDVPSAVGVATVRPGRMQNTQATAVEPTLYSLGWEVTCPVSMRLKHEGPRDKLLQKLATGTWANKHRRRTSFQAKLSSSRSAADIAMLFCLCLNPYFSADICQDSAIVNPPPLSTSFHTDFPHAQHNPLRAPGASTRFFFTRDSGPWARKDDTS